MAEEQVQRRLAAISALDVVGYRRLMDQNESGTLAALKNRRRAVLQPLVAKDQGRVCKIAGDGALAELGSAVDAVRCAIDPQEEMAAANGGLPTERQIVLRVGISWATWWRAYDDVVNVAARPEGIAEPGGILVSGSAFDHIREQMIASFEDLGSRPQALRLQ